VLTRSAVTVTDVLIGLVILLAIVVAAVAVLGIQPWGERGNGAAEGRDAARPDFPVIDPALIRYVETGSFGVGLSEVRALAVGPDDRIYVAGDRAVGVFDPGGAKQRQIALDDQPRCLAVGEADGTSPGRIYVGMPRHVQVVGPEGTPQAVWQSPGEKALFTSIAVAEQDVFVADAGNKIVWHYDASGRPVGRIGRPDKARGIPGFLITSEHFDLAVAPDGLLRVVNPRALRVEAYTFAGDLASSWRKLGSGIEGFFGCCNPAHLAILSDGRVVTAEKGISRVKVYNRDGEFLCVVAGPEQLPVTAADLAADGRDRVLILDAAARSVRIFEPKETHSETEP
jgi:hypothetical protein